MPFYRRLTTQLGRARVVVMGREPIQVLQAYVEEFGVRPTQVVSVGERVLKFRGTPTLVLVGTDAVVRSVWFGRRQTTAEEEAVIRGLE